MCFRVYAIVMFFLQLVLNVSTCRVYVVPKNPLDLN